MSDSENDRWLAMYDVISDVKIGVTLMFSSTGGGGRVTKYL